MRRAGARKKKTMVQQAVVNAQPDDFQDNDDELLEENFGNANMIKQPENLDEELPSKMLLPKDPQAPKNYAFYYYKDRAWKSDELVDQLTIHFSLEGDIIHKEGNEAKIQEEILETRTNLVKEAVRKAEQDDPSQHIDEGDIKKQMRNKFNYSERQTQTINEPIKERGVSTEPPNTDSYIMDTNQAEVFDSYMIEFEKEERQGFPRPEKSDPSIYSASFRRCIKIMERMVVQNEQQERYHEYKYFWANEQTESGKEGAMLPIWRYTGHKEKKRNVTSICWNPKYKDLFAVGFGSYDFLKPLVNPSLICIYTIKNSNHPEYTFTTECGVCSIDFHPTSPALLAVGLYDGTVQVYDIRSKFKKPIYQSSVRTNKHSDPVWQVKWNPDSSKGYNFYSISSDGRVTNWILMKNKLEAEEVIKLHLVGKNTEEDSSLIGSACGLCFDFNKFETHLFLVGTEEGKIHKCSRAFSGQFLQTYEGHLLAVYKVRWNPYHAKTFLSASADWTVKLWDAQANYPIMSFDRGTQFVDVVWAPYSSTVFAACTLDKVYVYDLQEDKYDKLSEQKPVKHPKLTNLCFNFVDPILLVGDTHGGVTLVKLSPNLTKGIDKKVPEALSGTDFDQYQYKKIDKLLRDMGKVDESDV